MNIADLVGFKDVEVKKIGNKNYLILEKGNTRVLYDAYKDKVIALFGRVVG